MLTPRKFIVCGFTIVMTANIYAEGITSEEFREIKNVAEQVSEPHSIIIGSGRSPTPIITYLQLSGEKAFNLPFSHYRQYDPSEAFLDRVATRIDEHFDRFLPSPEILGDRKIIVTDFSVTSDSLITVAYHLRRYLRSKGLNNEVEAVAMCASEHREKILENAKRWGTRIRTIIPGRNLLNNFQFSIYDSFAKYSPFDPNVQNTEQVSINPKHTKLVEEMKTHILEHNRNQTADDRCLPMLEAMLNSLLKSPQLPRAIPVN